MADRCSRPTWVFSGSRNCWLRRAFWCCSRTTAAASIWVMRISTPYTDTGDGPGKDVMAGLAAVEKLGVVDRNRIGVSGWSYGGYLTAWLSSHYDAWK